MTKVVDFTVLRRGGKIWCTGFEAVFLVVAVFFRGTTGESRLILESVKFEFELDAEDEVVEKLGEKLVADDEVVNDEVGKDEVADEVVEDEVADEVVEDEVADEVVEDEVADEVVEDEVADEVVEDEVVVKEVSLEDGNGQDSNAEDDNAEVLTSPDGVDTASNELLESNALGTDNDTGCGNLEKKAEGAATSSKTVDDAPASDGIYTCC